MSTVLNYLEASHEFRMTPELLKWLTKNAPLPGSSRRLAEAAPGQFLRSELSAFSDWMWSDWGSRYIPTGIAEELARERDGLCPVCRERDDVPEHAHLKRKDKELSFYTQHPHNLLGCCPSCHRRYDRLGSINLQTMLQWKRQAQDRMLAEVDRRIDAARRLSRLIGDLKAAQGSGRPSSAVAHALSAIVAELGVSAVSPSTTSAAEALRDLAEELKQEELRAALLQRGADALEHAEEDGDGDPVWAAIPVRKVGRCSREDGSYALIEAMVCAHCERELEGVFNEEPCWVGESEGGVEVGFEDPRDGGKMLAECECGSTEWHVEFGEFCSYCQHMWDRLSDND